MDYEVPLNEKLGECDKSNEIIVDNEVSLNEKLTNLTKAKLIINWIN